MLALHCEPRCDEDVVVSSPDVDSFCCSPLLMSSCDGCCDVAAALLPCESMKLKRSHKRSLRGKHVIVQSSFFRRCTLSLMSSFMIVITMLLLFLFGLSHTGCQMYLCFAVCCEEVASVWMLHTSWGGGGGNRFFRWRAKKGNKQKK